MNRGILLLIFSLCTYSLLSYADDPVSYGYDKDKSVIYAKTKSMKSTFFFNEDYTGNPSYAFSYFDGFPSIVIDSRSLHDATINVTLNYVDNKFIIDCIYSSVKSKRNGIFTKEGVCGLDLAAEHSYAKLAEQIKAEIIDAVDAVDTSLLINEKIKYLPIMLYNGKDKVVYKIYENKQDLLSDKYSIVVVKNTGTCEVYNNNPWVIYDKKDSSNIAFMDEIVLNDKIELRKATHDVSSNNKCASFPPIIAMQPKNFFYDSTYTPKKSYLIQGDKINLLSVSDDGKWCKVRYINIKNKLIDGLMLCSELSLPLTKGRE